MSVFRVYRSASRAGACLAALCLAHCGNSQPPVETPEQVAAEPSAATGEPAPAPAPDEAEPAAPSAEDDLADAEPEEDPNRQREVVYKSSPDGLVIETEGLTLVPTVKPIRTKGGWAAEVTVKASTKTESMYRLLSPKNGPLMFAAELERNGKVKTVADTREGDDEEFVSPGGDTTLTRQFPGKQAAPLWAGHSVKLFVGLWGLGKDAERRRPLRKLFMVRMVVGNGKPQPIIMPPE